MNIKLTQEQKHVIVELSKLKKQVQTLGGYAGTGKTTVISNLSAILPSFAVCAFTGKAANILRKKKLDAGTIHSIIYTPISLPDGSVEFELVSNLGYGGFIVDEASMISRDLYGDLLSFDVPVIFVGDHGQLEPVGEDVNLMKSPDLVLEKIHRNAGEIAHFAEHIRKGYRPASFEFKNPKKIKFLDRYDYSSIKHYQAQADQVICAYNKTRVAINKDLRESRGHTSDWPVVGDKIICLRNNKQEGLFNGMQGRVTDVDERPANRMVFETDDGMVFETRFDPAQFNVAKHDLGNFDRDAPNPFDFADAITCHKAQGDEFNKLMVMEQKCDLWDHVRWAYTAASRGKEDIVWVTAR